MLFTGGIGFIRLIGIRDLRVFICRFVRGIGGLEGVCRRRGGMGVVWWFLSC